jgi:epoxyqueuosine reductase
VSRSSIRIESRIKAEAFRLGFSLCGISSADPPVEYSRYEKWLEHGSQAGMNYLASTRHREFRKNPALLMPEIQSILSLGWAYPLHPMNALNVTDEAYLAGYTTGIDYHLRFPEILKSLAEFIRKELGEGIETKSYSDSSPILEREIASRAGLGWIGKNSCLISPQIGSAFLLAELFVSYPLLPDQPFQKEYCGTCSRCLETCPTRCIQSDRTIDSNKCISYLTIEHKGTISQSYRSSFDHWLFGCDICQSVCPWNRKSITQHNKENPLDLSMEKLVEILFISPAEFQQRFGESSISRAKWTGLIRNSLIFLGNNGDSLSLFHLERFRDQTNDPPLRETADWAINQVTIRKQP